MRRLLACAVILFLLAVGGVDAKDEPFRPRGRHNDAVHRFFPDLNSRFNAVRYGRWRAAEIAWSVGINRDLDREFSSYLLSLLADPPRYSPEPDLVAPRFARGAPMVFRALRWGQMLEQQLSDALAAADATPERTSQRLDRVLAAYRRERYALRDPGDIERAPDPAGVVIFSEAVRAAPVSARILSSGTALFVLSAEALAGPNFGEQRWRVMDTIGQFDRSFASDFGQPATAGAAAIVPAPSTESGALRPVSYRTSAPTVTALAPLVADQLDRLSRFRIEVFEALVPGGVDEGSRRQRDAALRRVAKRYGLPEDEIGGE